MSSYGPFFLFFFSSSYDMFTVNVSLATAEILKSCFDGDLFQVRGARNEANQKDFGQGQNSGLKEKIR